jgi:hypothetical protein
MDAERPANQGEDELGNSPSKRFGGRQISHARAGKRDAAAKLEQTIADAKARERLELEIRSRDFSE